MQIYMRKQHVALQRQEAVRSVLMSENFQKIIAQRTKGSGNAAKLAKLKEENLNAYLDEAERLCSADLAKVDFGHMDKADIELKDMFFMRVIMFPYTAPMFVYNALTASSTKTDAKADAREKTARALKMTLTQFN